MADGDWMTPFRLRTGRPFGQVTLHSGIEIERYREVAFNELRNQGRSGNHFCEGRDVIHCFEICLWSLRVVAEFAKRAEGNLAAITDCERCSWKSLVGDGAFKHIVGGMRLRLCAHV